MLGLPIKRSVFRLFNDVIGRRKTMICANILTICSAAVTLIANLLNKVLEHTGGYTGVFIMLLSVKTSSGIGTAAILRQSKTRFASSGYGILCLNAGVSPAFSNLFSSRPE